MWNTIMITGKIRNERVTIIEVEVIGLNQRARISESRIVADDTDDAES